MEKLVDFFLKDNMREPLIKDFEVLIDQEVADRGGVSGFAIKQGYKFVKKIKKDFVHDALQGMLPEFVGALDTFYEEHGKRQGFGDFLLKNKNRVANGLLGVTDERANSSSKAAIKKMYQKLRPMAQSNVEQSIPRMSKLVQKHVDKLP